MLDGLWLTKVESNSPLPFTMIMMFKRGWFNRGRIRSDEGFEVSLLDRAHIEYREGNRTVTMGGERLMDGFALEVATIERFKDGSPVIGAKRSEIVERTNRALESQRMKLDEV